MTNRMTSKTIRGYFTKFNFMEQISFVQVAKDLKITGISKLRFNANDFPYVTLLAPGARSNNVYFGKRSAEMLQEGGLSEGDSVTHLLKDGHLVNTTNEANEQRYKISLKGVSDYDSVTDLGIEEVVTDFDMKNFTKEFTTKDQTIKAKLNAADSIV